MGVEAGASIAAVRIIVLAVGRLRPPFADDVQHYQKLLAGHARVELIELRDEEHVARRVPDRAWRLLMMIPWSSASSRASAKLWFPPVSSNGL